MPRDLGGLYMMVCYNGTGAYVYGLGSTHSITYRIAASIQGCLNQGLCEGCTEVGIVCKGFLQGFGLRFADSLKAGTDLPDNSVAENGSETNRLMKWSTNEPTAQRITKSNTENLGTAL